MAVIRVNKTRDYTVMSNCHLKDKKLSLKGKGLLSLMLSLPDEWDYSIAGLVAISIEKETAIKATLDELKERGYLVVTKRMPNETSSGRIEYEYDIYEQPQEKQEVEKQALENLGVEILGVENQPQLNTKETITKESNTNKKKKESKSSFDAIIANYANGNEELTELLGEWLKVRKAKRAAMTDRAIQMNIDKLDKLAAESKMSVPDYLKEVIRRGWAAFFAINNYHKPPAKPNKFNNFNQRQYDYDAMEAMLLKQQNPPKTAGEDPDIQRRAEELQQRLTRV